MGRLKKILYLLIFLVAAPLPGWGISDFVPAQPTLGVEKLRAGMRGYMLTVMKGTKPVRLPIEIVSVVPQKSAIENTVLVRLLPSPTNPLNKVAQGMSGSPVYVDGKLIGAVGMGWNYSDHRMMLVTPIREMCRVFSWPEKRRTVATLSDVQENSLGGPLHAYLAAPLWLGGLGAEAVSSVKAAVGLPMESLPYGAAGELSIKKGTFAPGDAAAVLLVWGDVELGAIGTVTATAKDGRFLAFGHPFLGRGAVNFPVARALIHDTISSQAFPFKLGSPLSLIGTATQDRAAGIGGRVDYFTPSISAEFNFKDMDAGFSSRKNFRVIPDAFLGAKLLEGIYGGLVEDQWGRTGQGTAVVTLRVDGKNVDKGWARTNMFFAEDALGTAAAKEAGAIMEMFMLQHFSEVYPIGFKLDVSVTQEPKILTIEDVVVSSDAHPGDTLTVEVKLRPWRRRPLKRYFDVTLPQDATGACELVVRGGGLNSLSQLAVDGGWKSVDTFERMLTELNAMDANNEIIVELLSDQVSQQLRKSGTAGNDEKVTAELLPEEKEFLSETKARRIKEGTLRIARSEYVVDGIMKRLINVIEDDGAK